MIRRFEEMRAVVLPMMLMAAVMIVLVVPRAHADLLVSSGNTDQVLQYDGTTGTFVSVFASGGGLAFPQGLA